MLPFPAQQVAYVNAIAKENKTNSLLAEYQGNIFEIQKIENTFILVEIERCQDNTIYYEFRNYLSNVLFNSNQNNSHTLSFANYTTANRLNDFTLLNIYNYREDAYDIELQALMKLYNYKGSPKVSVLPSITTPSGNAATDTIIDNRFGNTTTVVLGGATVNNYNNTNNIYDIQSTVSMRISDIFGNVFEQLNIGTVIINDFGGTDKLIVDDQVYRSYSTREENHDLIIEAIEPSGLSYKSFIGSIRIVNYKRSSSDFRIESIASRANNFASSLPYPNDISVNTILPAGPNSSSPPSIDNYITAYEGVSHQISGNGQAKVINFTDFMADDGIKFSPANILAESFMKIFNSQSISGTSLRSGFRHAYQNIGIIPGEFTVYSGESITDLTVNFDSTYNLLSEKSIDLAIVYGRVAFALRNYSWTVNNVTGEAILSGMLTPDSTIQTDGNYLLWDRFDFDPQQPGSRPQSGEAAVRLYPIQTGTSFDILVDKSSYVPFQAVYNFNDLFAISQTFEPFDSSNPSHIISYPEDTIYRINLFSNPVFELPGGGYDIVQSEISYTLPANVENLILIGAEAIYANGNNLDNIIVGNANDNNIDGKGGADTLIGGLGDDNYYIDNRNQVIEEKPNEGYDIVFTPFGYTSSETSIEKIILTGSVRADIGGNELDNTLIGNDAQNVISGYAGHDVLEGKGGADTLIGGLGNDTYIMEHAATLITENGNEGIDTVKSIITISLVDNVENLTLTGAALINGTGNTLSNVLTGNSAANTLSGSSGHDTISGGDGNDAISGGSGSDLLYGENGDDSISGGGSGIDTLYGGAGNDTLSGGDDSDVMTGGTGNDLYIVDNAGDLVVEGTNEGTDTVQSSITISLADDVENLTLTGSQIINGTGNLLNNILIGNSVANVLSGSSGNDTIYGGAGNDAISGGSGSDLMYGEDGDDSLTGGASGNDSLYGGAGNDALNGGSDADLMEGGTGNDLFVVDHIGDTIVEALNEGTDTVQSSITYALDTNLENLTLTGIMAINGTGSIGNNILTGNSAINILSGSSGNDTLYGGAGNDALSGGSGSDLMYGEDGDDSLTGGASGNDNLYGGTGNDALNGSNGSDTLDGGTGNDLYAFALGDGLDVIQENDSTVGNLDKIQFDGSIVKAKVAVFMLNGNLQIGYQGNTTDQITIQGQNTAAGSVERLELSDGYFMTNADVNQVIQNMTSYASNNGISLTSLNDVKNNQDLLNIVAAGWHT